jgi:hypothetical protein
LLEYFTFRVDGDGTVYSPGAHNQLVYVSERYGAVAAVQSFDDTLNLKALLEACLESDEPVENPRAFITT